MLPVFNCLITDNVRMKGIGAASDMPQVADRFGVASMRDMLTGEWEDDAHFVCYIVDDTKDGEFHELSRDFQFRLRKSIRAQLTESGARIRCWGFVGDWDLNENVSDEMLHKAGWDGKSTTKPKISWTRDLLDKFIEETHGVVEALRAKDIGPSYIYLTNNGARFMHFYDQDQEPSVHEEIIRGMFGEYEALGYVLDDACVDWTRLFRAPKVVRSGRKTWEQPWFKAWTHNNWTVTQLAPRVTKLHDTYADVSEYVGDRPTPEECIEIFVENLSTNKKTDTYKKLKNLLHRRDCTKLEEILMAQDVTIPEGERDKTLTRLVGQLASHIYVEEWASPELMYAVLLPVAEQLEPDEGTQDWLEKTWGLCTRMWTKEHSKGVARKEQEQEVETERLDDLGHMLERVRVLYPKNKALHEHDAAAFEELSRMGLLKIGPSIFVLRPDGYYDPKPVESAVLPGSIRDLGSEFLMQTRIYGPRGGALELDAKVLLATHGRSLQAIVGSFGQPGAFIQDNRLIRPIFEWANHEPVHSEWVHTWLQMLGGKHWKEIGRWIAYAQDMRRPICALALVGARGVGKGMLARGLSELVVGSPVPASGQDLVEDFTPALTKSPFLVVDEGLPMTSRGVKDVADTFRRMVAGEPLWVNSGKFQPHIEINIPFRILFTANNREIVHGLVGNRTLTPADRAALAERIKFIELNDRAATWLRSNGGRDFTSGWVAGDGPSNFIVARHFRWLFENREELFGPPDSDRFLMSGDMESSIVDELRVLSGVTPEVAKACVYIIHTVQHSDEIAECISVDEEGFWITTNAVISYYNSTSTMDKKVRLNEKNVGVALQNLTTERIRGIKETGRGSYRQLRWRKLDLPFLLEHAQNHGLPTERIEAYMECLQ